MPRILLAERRLRNDRASPCVVQKYLSSVFRAEDALEARAGKLNANQALALCGSLNDVDDAPRCSKVGFRAARGVVGKRNADFEIGADGDVETRDERGAASA
jgi:hypothetical protein